MNKPEKIYPQPNETVPIIQSQDAAPTQTFNASQPAAPGQLYGNPGMPSGAGQPAPGGNPGNPGKSGKPSSSKKPKKKRSGTSWLVCFIILLLIALAVVLFVGQNDAKKAANKAAAASGSSGSTSSAEASTNTFGGTTASADTGEAAVVASPSPSIEPMGIQPAEAAPVEEEPSAEEEPAATVSPSEEPAENPAVFYDVDGSSDYYDAVTWAAERGIVISSDDGLFYPDEGCTRADVVTFLWRLAGEPTADTSTNSFDDVTDPTDPSYTAILWAVENGITSGTDENLFSPDETVTRAQMVIFLYRYADSPLTAPAAITFEDVDPDSPAYNAVYWALGAGITSGTSDTTFSPDEECTRGQVITFLYRYAG